MESVHKLDISRTNVGLDNGLSHGQDGWSRTADFRVRATGGPVDAARILGKAPVDRTWSGPVGRHPARWSERNPDEHRLFEREFRCGRSRLLDPGERRGRGRQQDDGNEWLLEPHSVWYHHGRLHGDRSGGLGH